MSTTDESTPAPRFGWLPKLLLWALVIAIGVLYLASMNRHREDARSQAEVESEAPPAGITPPIQPPADVVTAEGPDPAAPDLEPGRQLTTDGDPQQEGPVQAAEAEAFASSVMTAEPAPAETVPPDAALEHGASAPAPPVATQTPLPDSAPSASEPRSAAMQPGASPDSTGPESPPEPPLRGTRSATGDPAAVPAARPEPRPQATLQQRRARILAEYEAMHRAARGPMGRGSEGYPAPGVTPYGYPAGPGYGSPGYPWGYMPPLQAR